jgi:hypothetical protein
LAAAIVATAVALIGMPAAAQAACPTVPTAQKFKQFGDQGWYNIAPGGAFESKSWTYVGSPNIITGNEPWKIGSSGDARAISLPPGSSVTSPSICVGVDNPHFRFFARGAGGEWGTLFVRMRYTDPNTKKLVVQTVGSLDFSANQRNWVVSPQMGLGNSLPIWGTQTLNVQLVFEPNKDAGGFAIDDVYIDPYRKS